MTVSKMMYIARKDLENNRDKLFLFGDNLLQLGMGGQAEQMRYEPNAIGIPTKKFPSMSKGSFFCDDDFDNLKPTLDKIFAEIKTHKHIVIPEDGIGTGLARLDKKAPKIFKYIQDFLNSLEE